MLCPFLAVAPGCGFRLILNRLSCHPQSNVFPSSARLEGPASWIFKNQNSFDFSTHAKNEESYGALFEFEFYMVIYHYVKLMPVYTLHEQYFPFLSPSGNHSQFLHDILWKDLFSVRNNSEWHLLNIPYGLWQCWVLSMDYSIQPLEAVIVINLLW